jgi:hypothetical protein
MRATKRRRPLRRSPCVVPVGVDLVSLAARVSYVGSPEHKTFPSFAGPPRPRADATKCDPTMADRDVLTAWLRQAVADGHIGEPWEGDFPRYVWHLQDGVMYEGRLVNQELGQYKGWPLDPDQWPEGVQ